MTTHIVLDLETLSIERNAIVLSVGMVIIKHLGIVDKFRINIDAVEQEELYGRVSDEQTKAWWRSMMNTPEGRDAWNAAVSRPTAVKPALKAINEVFADVGAFKLWGNANTFDNEILRSLFEVAGFPAWNFRNDRDFRTLKDLYKEKVPEPEFQGIRHVAVDDALHEANWLIQILKYIEAH